MLNPPNLKAPTLLASQISPQLLARSTVHLPRMVSGLMGPSVPDSEGTPAQ